MARKAAQQKALPRLEAAVLEQTWQAFVVSHNKDDVCRNRLAEHYRYIVQYQAERVHSKLPEGVELEDLAAAGFFGLLDALRRFDVDRAVKFETYCVPRIRGAMIDSLREMDWVPRLVRARASRLGHAMTTLTDELGRQPTTKELAKALDMKVADLEQFIEEARPTELMSLHKKWYETDAFKEVRELDILVDKKSPRPSRRTHRLDFMRKITRGLNRNERLIMLLYYYEEQTMKEIGNTLDLSESRVSQMHSAIIGKLQMTQSKEDLQNYLVV
jgi:RNA polymerase sigma factor FliA